MKNPNLQTANVRMSMTLKELLDAGCTVLSAHLRQDHGGIGEFKYSIQVQDTPEYYQWINESSYHALYNAEYGTHYVPFLDGEVFCRV